MNDADGLAWTVQGTDIGLLVFKLLIYCEEMKHFIKDMGRKIVDMLDVVIVWIKERNIQEAMLSVQSRYGKNAMLRGTNLQEGATTVTRNKQIGGHRA